VLEETMKTLRTLALFSAVWVLSATLSSAGPLYLNAGLPDLNGAFMDVSYDADSDVLQATGWTAMYTDANTNEVTLWDIGSYSITANIDSSGLLNGGSLEIKGDIGAGMQTLLTGELNTGANGVAYDLADPWETIYLYFTVNGGTEAAAFGGVNTPNAVVTLSPYFGEGVFNGTWDTSFANDGVAGYCDINAPIPEPSSSMLLLVGGLCVAAWRRLQTRG
jgi:hypothetical protein